MIQFKELRASLIQLQKPEYDSREGGTRVTLLRFRILSESVITSSYNTHPSQSIHISVQVLQRSTRKLISSLTCSVVIIKLLTD